jgi:hypothetical protein
MGYPDCKNVIDVPDDVKLDWTPPSKVAVPKTKMHRKVRRALK